MKSKGLMLILLVVSALLLGACGDNVGAGPSGETTCARYNAMGSGDWLHNEPTEEQRKILIRMLKSKDRGTGDSTIEFVHMGVNSYCIGISKENNPIENSFDWTKNPLEIEIGW